jgi:hypothetical protein
VKDKSLFISFINEGDLVALAQDEYMQSLVQAWMGPVKDTPWVIPTPLYISSGDLVVLRCENDENGEIKTISPLRVNNSILQTVLFGDPVMHSMTMYEDRVQRILKQNSTPQNPFQDPE